MLEPSAETVAPRATPPRHYVPQSHRSRDAFVTQFVHVLRSRPHGDVVAQTRRSARLRPSRLETFRWY
ncbi:unnamed protein product, partial [Iphiclides podalirius]